MALISVMMNFFSFYFNHILLTQLAIWQKKKKNRQKVNKSRFIGNSTTFYCFYQKLQKDETLEYIQSSLASLFYKCRTIWLCWSSFEKLIFIQFHFFFFLFSLKKYWIACLNDFLVPWWHWDILSQSSGLILFLTFPLVTPVLTTPWHLTSCSYTTTLYLALHPRPKIEKHWPFMFTRSLMLLWNTAISACLFFLACVRTTDFKMLPWWLYLPLFQIHELAVQTSFLSLFFNKTQSPNSQASSHHPQTCLLDQFVILNWPLAWVWWSWLGLNYTLFTMQHTHLRDEDSLLLTQ